MPGKDVSQPKRVNSPTRHDLYKLPFFRRWTGPLRTLPDYIIIGAQKAGTTTVYDNLVKHPAIEPCDIKEVHFFDKNWDKGLNWYRAHFPFQSQMSNSEIGGKRITGEGSPYYLFHPLVPQRIKDSVPNAKLIVVLRNPVERAYSHFQHEVRKGREPLSFAEALAAESDRLKGEEEKIINNPTYQGYNHQHFSYAARGMYAKQLQRWFKVFPKEQFLILTNEDLARNFHSTLKTLHDFLEVENVQLEDPKRSNVGNYSKMDNDVRELLLDIYREPNRELEALLGRKLNWD